MRVLMPIEKMPISFSVIFFRRHASQPQQNKKRCRRNLRLSNQTDFAKDYAETSARWRQQFLKAWPDIQTIGLTAAFKNMWEYYLAYCEAGFQPAALTFRTSRLTALPDQLRLVAPPTSRV